jgi:putative transcriptional regulator
VDSLQGHFLVASRRLIDPNFHRAVVLVVKHDEDGALGLVVNRPLSVTVKQVLEQALDRELDVVGHVHQGGPCEGPLMVVYEDPDADPDGAEPVLDGVFFTAERGTIEDLLRHHDGPLKFFANYSGWGAGQIEREMAEGSWLKAPATKEQVFHPGPKLWDQLVTQALLGKPLPPQIIPDDPSMN